MGFGFVVERFGLFLQLVARIPVSLLHRGFTLWVGVALMLLGIATNVIAIIQFSTVVKGFGAAEIPLGYWTDAGSWISGALTVVTLVLVIYFVMTA